MTPRTDRSGASRLDALQAKIAADDGVRLDALQQLGFQLVEGEVDLALPVGRSADSGCEVATPAEIPRLRELAAQAFAQSRFRAPGMPQMPAAVFYAQWIENAVRGRSITSV